MATAARSRGTRRSTLLRRSDPGRGIMFWIKRGVMSLVLVVFLGWCGAWILMSGAHSSLGQWVEKKIVNVTGDAGYKVEDIILEGRTNTGLAEIKQAIDMDKGDPIFRFDPVSAKASLENMSWVKTAYVQRRLPDTIYIKLVERKPFALWQTANRLAVIDETGSVLTDKDVSRFKDLMMIRGDGAAAQAKDLALMLGAEPTLLKRVDHAVRIENRRWDLILKDGKLIKMPEKDMGLAMRNLMVHHQSEGILDKPLTSIDVRDPTRLIVRTEIGKVQDYTASLNGEGQSL